MEWRLREVKDEAGGVREAGTYTLLQHLHHVQPAAHPDHSCLHVMAGTIIPTAP